MNWRPPPPDVRAERDAEEDEQAERDDRKIVRLAAREIGTWADVDEHDAWVIVTRIKALRRAGQSAEDIKLRLHP